MLRMITDVIVAHLQRRVAVLVELHVPDFEESRVYEFLDPASRLPLDLLLDQIRAFHLCGHGVEIGVAPGQQTERNQSIMLLMRVLLKANEAGGVIATDKRVGGLIGVEAQSISRWRTGTTTPRGKKLDTLLAAIRDPPNGLRVPDEVKWIVNDLFGK